MLAACSPQTTATTPLPADGSQQGLRQIPLTIGTATGARAFKVEVASSAEEQRLGLMHRRALTKEGGMLFPFADAQPVSFWMKDTIIPLDMIFIREDGTIARIETAQPLNLDPVYSLEPVTAVLEIQGGLAQKLGIAPGDRVKYTL